MADPSPHTSGLCQEFKPPVRDTGPRAKRLLDSAEHVQALQSAKKPCVLSHHCSSPNLSEKLLLCSPGSASFQESSHFLDDTGHEDLVVSSPASKYDDVAISLDITRCFDDSEPDDSLLELSDSEEGNSPFSYTEEEIQEILADDCTDSEWYQTRKSTLSQDVNGESGKDESGSCTGASVISEDANVASEIAEEPGKPPPSESSSDGSECYRHLSNESAGLDESQLQSAQVTRMLFDLDIQELLSLSPIDAGYVDQPLEDNCLEEAEREASGAIVNDCLEYDTTASSCVLKESLEEVVSNGQQSPAGDCPGKSPLRSRDVSGFCGDPVETSVSSSALACGQSTADGGSAPLLPRGPTPSSGSRNQELSKATKSCFSRKLDFPADGGQESSEAEQSSDSIKLSDTAVGQIGQEETTSGKKPGKVIPIPQEEERLNQQTCISEAELEQNKHLYPECACPYEGDRSSYSSYEPTRGIFSLSTEIWIYDAFYTLPLSQCHIRGGGLKEGVRKEQKLPKIHKKPPQKYSLTQWVTKNVAKHHHFQCVPDCSQRSPVTAFSNLWFCC